LGSSYSAIELRPLALNLVDYTRLSESRTQRVFFLIFQNRKKPFFLGDLQYMRAVTNFVRLFRPAN
jgi:predicted nucleic acid-binding protein